MVNTILDKKVDFFYKRKASIFKKPLEKIINVILIHCTYINGESLERHNWGDNPVKLNLNFEKLDLTSDQFEKKLFHALSFETDETKSIIEVLWGDIQLGKRIQACMIMWISVNVLKRPVLYIFRNLKIDQKQLQDDIMGTEKYNFNIQFIKQQFDYYFEELELAEDDWKEFKLPELKDISNNDVLNKLNNKEAMNSNDIYCCLMNDKQLEKIKNKFMEYVYYYDEKVNITVLVDESDLMGPSSSNDGTNKNDEKDTTKCEKFLAQIYTLVIYVLHITGTAHSLLYNVTTCFNESEYIQLKVSKVHKMKRSIDYYGLFSDGIYMEDSLVYPWWEYKYEQKKRKYDIVEDYNINIKKIIQRILVRPTKSYNSLLISEEKVRVNQFSLIDKIISDFPDIFLIIYHGHCLRLYLPDKYLNLVKECVIRDSSTSNSKRLNQPGGIYGDPETTCKLNILPNNYCYYDIDTKILNIKYVYKVLSILLKDKRINTNLVTKTVITITGKYGERGFSFTSDDYKDFTFHLTDQYYVSHGSLNCPDVSQFLRLQGKYNDQELKNGDMRLTLWTTAKLKNSINLYVIFIKIIEKLIMKCTSWEHIKDMLEGIIDGGQLKFGDLYKVLAKKKYQKNTNPKRYYDKGIKGYRLFTIDNMKNDTDIKKICDEYDLPDYICINHIEETSLDNFIDKYGIYACDVPLSFPKNMISNLNDRNVLDKSVNTIFPQLNELKLDRIIRVKQGDPNNRRYNGVENAIIDQRPYQHYVTDRKPNTYNIFIYEEYPNMQITITCGNKCLPYETNNYIKKTPYSIQGDKVRFSVIKEEYIRNSSVYGIPKRYYWKTPDEWLCYYDEEKPEILSYKIIDPVQIRLNTDYVIPTSQIIDPIVSQFVSSCCKTTEQQNLRFGIKDIYQIYEKWCRNNSKKYIKTQKNFKEEFEKLNYREEKSKGIDINKKKHKRGYNIMVTI